MLQSYRKKNGLTQEKLAEYADIDIRTVQRIEKGFVIPSLETFVKLVTTLNLSDKEIVLELKEIVQKTTTIQKENLKP